MFEQAGRDFIHIALRNSVIALPLVRPHLNLMDRISTCSIRRSDERPAQNLLLLLTTCWHLYELCNDVWVVNCKLIHFLQIQIDCQHINYDLRQHNMEAYFLVRI